MLEEVFIREENRILLCAQSYIGVRNQQETTFKVIHNAVGRTGEHGIIMEGNRLDRMKA
jgi:hypothetical protein